MVHIKSITVKFLIPLAIALTLIYSNVCLVYASPSQPSNELNSATVDTIRKTNEIPSKTFAMEETQTTTNITLEWDPNKEESVTGYLLYYGNASGKYLPPVDVGLHTSYTLKNIDTRQKWYFAVKAYDDEGNQSDYSNEVVKDQTGTNPNTTKPASKDPVSLNEEFGINPDVSQRTNTTNSGRLIAGTGPWTNNGGWIKTLTYDNFHDYWSRLDWPYYNKIQGESRIARGDIDGDGKDEIIVGLGSATGDKTVPAGYFQVLDDDFQSLYWGQVDWSEYNENNGEVWPACGDLDGDGKDEILIGLGRGGMGYVEVFSVTNNKLVHKAWITSSWDEYNQNLGEVRPTAGDLNGDGKSEIILGFGPVADNPEIPGGSYEVLSRDGQHLNWGLVSWNDYNQLNGESRPVIGDLDNDGINEIIIGLGSGANGSFEIQGFNDAGSLTNQAWLATPWWQAYNNISGETRPVVGNLDDDDDDEIAVALGKGGGGWIHLFDDKDHGNNHYLSLQLWPEEYNLQNGASWITIQE